MVYPWAWQAYLPEMDGLRMTENDSKGATHYCYVKMTELPFPSS